jgi:hypothetical protein
VQNHKDLEVAVFGEIRALIEGFSYFSNLKGTCVGRSVVPYIPCTLASAYWGQGFSSANPANDKLGRIMSNQGKEN